jgi:hypothetical protein
MPSKDFAKFITDESEKVLKHHYLSVTQHQRFKDLQMNLGVGQLIIWGDFSENYTPVTQDAIQSDYFNNRQITLHPFTVYYRDGTELKCLSYCVFSDSTIHDTNTFYAFQSALIRDLKNNKVNMNIEEIKQIFYFSDGCAGQYKNRKNFTNLYHHKADFGIEAEWNFFATAHGKGPCDAIGGTVKRILRIASLRGSDIVTADQAYKWCKENIKNIRCINVNTTEIETVVERKDLTTRYESLSTIHGTQQCHKICIQGHQILAYETSQDHETLTTRDMKNSFDSPVIIIDESMISDWVVCQYDRKWYLGIIRDINMNENEVEIDFWKNATPNKPGALFTREDKSCWIPIAHLLKKLAPPKASRTGRTVSVCISEQKLFDQLLSSRLVW